MDELFSRFDNAGRKPIALLPDCGKCGLKRGCKSPMMPVAGKGRKGIMVIGEAPGEVEDLKGKPFVGPAGQFLQRHLRQFDVDLFEDCWVVNALSCRPPANKIDDDRKIEFCRPLVIQAIEFYQPTTVLLLGKMAMRSVIGHLWGTDIGELGRWTGWNIPCIRWNAWITTTYHPSHIMRMDSRDEKRDPIKQKEFAIHIGAAVNKRTRPHATIPDYNSKVRIEMDDREVARVLAKIPSGRSISFDFETTTLKPQGPHAEIVSCSVSIGERMTIAYPWYGKAASATRDLLFDESVPKIGWNVCMEDPWSRFHLGGPVRGWKADGMLMAHVLDCRKGGVTGLKFQAFVQLGVEDYSASVKQYLEGTDKSGNSKNRIREIRPITSLLLYNGLDSLFEHIIVKRQMREFA